MEKSERLGREISIDMRRKLSEEYKISSVQEFAEILLRAYEKGISDGTITVERLIEDIKSELIKMKID